MPCSALKLPPKLAHQVVDGAAHRLRAGQETLAQRPRGRTDVEVQVAVADVTVGDQAPRPGRAR